MDQSLMGTLLLGVAFLPWVAEVFWQVRLQPRVLEALPPAARAALPPHPRRAALAFVSSARFQLAFWRLARRELEDDSPRVRALKRQVRASVVRELGWIVVGLGTLAVLVANGWRPGWP
jgi:endonuclease/exonuclease/phosphatase (EEP) superfamily protein YafD